MAVVRYHYWDTGQNENNQVRFEMSGVGLGVNAQDIGDMSDSDLNLIGRSLEDAASTLAGVSVELDEILVVPGSPQRAVTVT